MNEFINNHIECIEMPISKGSLQGFLLNNGFRIFFKKNESLTWENRTRLINWYNKHLKIKR
jgi:hypothetical protein